MKTIVMKHENKDDAVSPVVGVMLMLVVTIVIAAVVAVFATGVVSDVEPAPISIVQMDAYQGSPDVNTKLVMSLKGGNPIDVSKISVILTDDTGDYSLVFKGFDQNSSVGSTLDLAEKLKIFTFDDIDQFADEKAAIGDTYSNVKDRIMEGFEAGELIHVMVTFNNNTMLYDRDIVIKDGKYTSEN